MSASWFILVLPINARHHIYRAIGHGTRAVTTHVFVYSLSVSLVVSLVHFYLWQ